MADRITLEQVLELAKQLPSHDQVRLRAALTEVVDEARRLQVQRNRSAIALLDKWQTSDAVDSGVESWEDMLRDLDAHRESERELYPDLHQDDAKSPQ